MTNECEGYAPKAEDIKELRRITGAGMMDCKRALVECTGNITTAIEALRKKGLATVSKKAERTASMGLVESYIHLGGKIGVLVEINCETDFVAKTDEFKLLTKELAMHIAAANPLYVKREDIPEEVVAKEKEIQKERVKEEGGKKPDNIIDKIVEGRLGKYYSEVCLLEQPFIRDDTKKVLDLVNDVIARVGENIQIKRFARFQIGD
jgi:elongation factor Ts